MAIKNNWWKKTFNKTYFSLREISNSRSQLWAQKEIQLITVFHLKKGANILDVPCGKGQHSVELAKKGFKVTGVDYSSTVLNIAKKWAQYNKVFPIFIKQDMRSLKLNKRFDAVIMLGNSFGYFPDIDNERVIKNISALLKRGGLFMIHLLNPVEVLRQFDKKSEFKIPRGSVKIENISFHPMSFIKESRWVIMQDNNKKKLNVKFRLYTFPEIKLLLSKYKLNIIKTYGSLDKKPYNFNSPAMIIIAKKIT